MMISYIIRISYMMISYIIRIDKQRFRRIKCLCSISFSAHIYIYIYTIEVPIMCLSGGGYHILFWIESGMDSTHVKFSSFLYIFLCILYHPNTFSIYSCIFQNCTMNSTPLKLIYLPSFLNS